MLQNKLKTFCNSYKTLDSNGKDEFLSFISKNYSIDHAKVMKAINQCVSFHLAIIKFKIIISWINQISVFFLLQRDLEPQSAIFLKTEHQLKTALSPQYLWLFKYIGRLEDGVKFLVDFRTDVLVKKILQAIIISAYNCIDLFYLLNISGFTF